VAWVHIDDKQPECSKSPTELVIGFKNKYHSKVCILLAASVPKACKHVVSPKIPKFKTNRDANSLFLKPCHFTGPQRSQNTINKNTSLQKIKSGVPTAALYPAIIPRNQYGSYLLHLVHIIPTVSNGYLARRIRVKKVMELRIQTAPKA
jgi:hypothetical protein